MKDLWGKVDGAILIMAVFLLVVFGMLVQKALTTSERLPIQRDTMEYEDGWKWMDYEEVPPNYQYAKRLKYEQRKAA